MLPSCIHHHETFELDRVQFCLTGLKRRPYTPPTDPRDAGALKCFRLLAGIGDWGRISMLI